MSSTSNPSASLSGVALDATVAKDATVTKAATTREVGTLDTSVGVPSANNSTIYGNWIQYKAATAGPVRALKLFIWASIGSVETWQIQVGIGIATAEVPIMEESLQTTVAAFSWSTMLTGLFIPAGTRIAVRVRNRTNNNAETANVWMLLLED